MKHVQTDRITTSVLLLLALCLGVFLLSKFLLAIILGVMLKVILAPMYAFLRKHKWGPKLSAATLITALILIIVGPVSYMVAKAASQGVAIATDLSHNPDFSLTELINKAYRWEPLNVIASSPQQLEEEILKGLDSFKNFAASFLLIKIGALPGLIVQAFITFMVCFFLLVDEDKLKNYVKGKLPLDPTLQKKIGERLERTTLSSFWATMAAATSQAICMGFGFLVLGMPAAFFALSVTFVSAWIPLLGSSPVWIAGTIYLLIKKMYAKVFILVAIGLFTGVVDNIARSWVLKGRDNMHPAVALLAIFGGITFFGIAGVFIGPVIASLVLTLFDIWSTLFKKTA